MLLVCTFTSFFETLKHCLPFMAGPSTLMVAIGCNELHSIKVFPHVHLFTVNTNAENKQHIHTRMYQQSR